jgi:hypothetical protein
MHGPSGIGDQRAAVEHHRVLAADAVDVGDGDPEVAAGLLQQRVAAPALVALERRGVDRQDHLGAGGHGRMQRLGEPHVLADEQAECDALEFEHAVAAVRVDHEVAALVEHRVVGQLALAVGALDAAVAQDAGGVVDHRTRALGPADDGGDATGRGRRDPCHRLLEVVQEARPQQQVLGRIARQRQLREQHQVRPVLVPRLGDHRRDPVGVVVDGADREVELGQGDAQGFGHVWLAADS